ncbi:MAG: DUF494 family protein [Legionella sp.]|nr:DUF494 family protein [Legionella sp.]
MKDNLFEMLMNLFETSLTKLQERQTSHTSTDDESTAATQSVELKFIQTAKSSSTRIFTQEEQLKLSKSSYQFLKRMVLWSIIDSEVLELIMNQLSFSDSNIITLEETKWTIRTVLSTFLNEDQLSFLDLVLYQKEDAYLTH